MTLTQLRSGARVLQQERERVTNREEVFRIALAEFLDRRGMKAQWAKQWGVSHVFLRDMARGQRPLSDAFLAKVLR